MPKNKVNILLINNHSIQNLGDALILHQTIDLLTDEMPNATLRMVFNDIDTARSAFPDHEILRSPLSFCTSLDENKNYQLSPKPQRAIFVVTFLIACVLNRIFGVKASLFRCAEKKRMFAAFADADMVLACGGGYIYSISPTWTGEGLFGWFTLMLLGCIGAAIMKKKLILLPQSIGPLQDSIQRRAVAFVLRRAESIYVREQISHETVRTSLQIDRAICSPDLAFGARAVADSHNRNQNDPQVGMTLINWSGQNFVFHAQQEYETAMLGFIDALTEQNYRVVLFAQCHGPSAAEDDRQTNLRLHARARNPHRVRVDNEYRAPDAQQMAYGQMDYFVGTRMHSVIMALNANIPAMAVGYLHKSLGMMREVGLEEYCVDIENVTMQILIQKFSVLVASNQTEPISSYMQRARQSKCEIVRKIAEGVYA
jgi:colanic acid/amylovoran biosynthesis protein